MKIFFRIFNAICYRVGSFLAKLRWGDALVVDGIFRKRADTQVTILDNGKITIQRNVSFQRNVSLSAAGEGKLNIGSNVAFNRNCVVVCRKGITIEDDVMFGPGVTIYDHDHIFSYEGILPGFNHGEITIGKGCWIAANVTILRGANIGEGSVIGAGCIVKGTIPPHSLVMSNRELTIIPIESRSMQNG